MSKSRNEIVIVEISVDVFSRGFPSLYWAEKDFLIDIWQHGLQVRKR